MTYDEINKKEKIKHLIVVQINLYLNRARQEQLFTYSLEP